MRKILTIIGILVFGLSMVALEAAVCAPAEKAVKPADFYRGQTIQYINCAAPGSDLGLSVRVTAPYLKQYTGATVIVKDMTGAGGIEGHNFVWRAKPDGLTIGMHQLLTIALSDIMDDPGHLWDMARFGYIYGQGLQPPVFCVKPDGPYQSIEALKAAKNLKFGGDSPKSNHTLGGCSVADVLGLDAKVIPGHKSAEIALAISQGHLHGCAFVLGLALQFGDQGQVKPLFVFDSKRHRQLPNIPALTELVRLEREKESLVKLWGGRC